MKIVTIVGARPQFIKAATVSRAIAQWNLQTDKDTITEMIIHTGQHFDHNMSQTFFDQLSIPAPKHNLNIHGSSHGKMTGQMLEKIENCLTTENPEEHGEFLEHFFFRFKIETEKTSMPLIAEALPLMSHKGTETQSLKSKKIFESFWFYPQA